MLTFGLGNSDKAELVEIRWPNAERTVTTLKDLPAGHTYLIDEKSGEVERMPLRR